jgi:hypothetical protein
VNEIRRPIIWFLCLLWTTILLAGYYVYHIPFREGLGSLPILSWSGLPNIGNSLFFLARDLLAAIFILLFCIGLGRLLIGRYRLDGLDGFAIQTALGAGIASLIWLGLAWTGFLEPWLAWGISILGIIIFRDKILDAFDQLKVFKDYWTFSGRMERFFLVGSALMLGSQIWIALAPPLKYDALTYHLALLKIYILSIPLPIHIGDRFKLESCYIPGQLPWVGRKLPP